MRIGSAISVFKSRGSSVVLPPFVPPYDVSPGATLKLLNLDASDTNNLLLNGSDVEQWNNSDGLSGINTSVSSNNPTYNATDGSLVFSGAATNPMKLISPIELNGDKGFTIFIAFKQVGNDKYLFGGDNMGSSSLLLRGGNISLRLGSLSFRTYSYTQWGESKRTGRAILQITHTGAGGTVEFKLDNGTAYAGVGSFDADKFYLNEIGNHSADTITTRGMNGEVAQYLVFNAPLDSANSDIEYNKLALKYPPQG